MLSAVIFFMFGQISDTELLKIPRIAIIYSDPDWADFIEPVKDASILPPSLFKNIHIKDIETELFAFTYQYLLTIIVPNTINHSKVDLGQYKEEWIEYFNQGSFLMVFGTDVGWLSALGPRFQIKGLANEGVKIVDYNFTETSIMKNSLYLEGLSALDPWLGEYTDFSDHWIPVTTSENGLPTMVTQIMGNAQITLSTTTMAKDNMKLLFPLRTLFWGIHNSWLSRRSDADSDFDDQWHASFEAEVPFITEDKPANLTLVLNSFSEDGFEAGDLTLKYRLMTEKKDVVAEKTSVFQIDQGSRDFSHTFSLSWQGWADDDYLFDFSVEGPQVDYEGELWLKVIANEIKEKEAVLNEIKVKCEKEIGVIVRRLEDLKSRYSFNFREQLDLELQKSLLPNQNSEILLKPKEKRLIARSKRLLYLRNRLQNTFEVLDVVFKQEKSPYPKEPGFEIGYTELKTFRMFYDEVVTKAKGLLFEVEIPHSFGNTPNQEKNLWIHKLTDNFDVDILWEFHGDDPINQLVNLSFEKLGLDYLSVWHNGIYLFSMSIKLHEPKSMEGVRERLEDAVQKRKELLESGQHTVEPPHLVWPNLDAPIDVLWAEENTMFTRTITQNFGRNQADGVLLLGNLEIKIHCNHPPLIHEIGRWLRGSTPFTADLLDKFVAMRHHGGVSSGITGGQLVSILLDKAQQKIFLPEEWREFVPETAKERPLDYYSDLEGVSESENILIIRPHDEEGIKFYQDSTESTSSLHAFIPSSSKSHYLPSFFSALEILDDLVHARTQLYSGDLHSCSVCSSGFLLPQDSVYNAISAGLDLYTLTDHQSITPNRFLCEFIEKNQILLETIPGAQEITFNNLHAIALNANSTVDEVETKANPIEDAKEVGADVLFAGTVTGTIKQNRWPAEQRKLGSDSDFLAFFCKHENLKYDWDDWNQTNRIPLWLCGTANDSGYFGVPYRSYFFIDHPIKEGVFFDTQISQFPLLNYENFKSLVLARKTIGLSRMGYYGNPEREIVLELLAGDQTWVRTFFLLRQIDRLLQGFKLLSEK